MILQYFLALYHQGFFTTNIRSSAEWLVINVTMCVVCFKLSCYPTNCCDLAWPIEIEYIFFMLLALQLTFNGPIQCIWFLTCEISATGAASGVCGSLGSVLSYVPSLALVFCSGLVHFWVSASWSICCPKCTSAANSPDSGSPYQYI